MQTGSGAGRNTGRAGISGHDFRSCRRSYGRSGPSGRTFPQYLPGFRGQGQNTVDIEAMKRFFLGETRNLQVRCDFLNAFNHPEFSNPSLSPTSGSFGQVTSQANFPRNIQVGLWLNF